MKKKILITTKKNIKKKSRNGPAKKGKTGGAEINRPKCLWLIQCRNPLEVCHGDASKTRRKGVIIDQRDG